MWFRLHPKVRLPAARENSWYCAVYRSVLISKIMHGGHLRLRLRPCHMSEDWQLQSLVLLNEWMNESSRYTQNNSSRFEPFLSPVFVGLGLRNARHVRGWHEWISLSSTLAVLAWWTYAAFRGSRLDALLRLLWFLGFVLFPSGYHTHRPRSVHPARTQCVSSMGWNGKYLAVGKLLLTVLSSENPMQLRSGKVATPPR